MPSEGRSRQALRAELPVFDQDSLVERVLGDVDIARQVAARAIDDITRHRIGLSEALESADSEKLHFHAHSLKGVSKLMECHQLARCAEVIERQSTHQIIAETFRIGIISCAGLSFLDGGLELINNGLTFYVGLGVAFGWLLQGAEWGMEWFSKFLETTCCRKQEPTKK